MCRFWGADPVPFGKVKPRGMYPDYIWGLVFLSPPTILNSVLSIKTQNFAVK